MPAETSQPRSCGLSAAPPGDPVEPACNGGILATSFAGVYGFASSGWKNIDTPPRNQDSLPNQRICLTENKPNKTFDVIRRRRMHADRDNAAPAHPRPSLQRDLPEIAVKREKNSALGFCPLQNRLVARARKIIACPQDLVAGMPQIFDNPARKILICEKLHSHRIYADNLCRQGIRAEFVGQMTGIRQASKQIFPLQTWVARENVALGLPGSEQFQNQLYREPRPAHDGFSGKHVGVHFNPIPPIHTARVPRIVDPAIQNPKKVVSDPSLVLSYRVHRVHSWLKLRFLAPD